jgi:hypothetical protein
MSTLLLDNINNTEQLSKIKEALLPIINYENGCFVWIGSGLSANQGFKTWKEFLKETCQKLNINSFDDYFNNGIIDPEKLIDIAEECKIKDKDGFFTLVNNHYGDQTINTREAYLLLYKIGIKNYITTNFDSLLYKTLSILEAGLITQKYPAANLFIAEDKILNVSYIHGKAIQNQNPPNYEIVFARTDYDEAYENTENISTFLKSIFYRFSFLLF